MVGFDWDVTGRDADGMGMGFIIFFEQEKEIIILIWLRYPTGGPRAMELTWIVQLAFAGERGYPTSYSLSYLERRHARFS